MKNLFGKESKWIYQRTTDNKTRYILGKEGIQPLVCIGVNPSTAEPGKLDPTLTRVERYAKRLKYDGWIMINLYPQRATKPDDLHPKIDEWIFKRNMFHITSLVRRKFARPLTVWAAWGTLIEKRSYLIRGLRGLYNIFDRDKWVSIGGLTMKGHPRHPLYTLYNAPIKRFGIKAYLEAQEAGI